MDAQFYLDKYFPQFEDDLKKELAQLAMIKEIKQGEQLMQTGKYIKSTILVISGRLKVFRESSEGEIFMYYLEAGNACALSLLCAQQKKPSEILAQAEQDSIALLIPIEILENLVPRYKTWYQFVIGTYQSRFEELLTLVDQIAFRAMDERLINYLEQQRKILKTNQLQITHQAIATDLNSSREVISRLLKKLEQTKRVRLQRNFIELI
jgi:CRP/FNR family transcriptional regulator